MVDGDLIGQMVPQMAHIVPFHRAIDDHIQPHRHGGNHHVVQHAAVFIEKQRVTHLALFKRGYVAGNHRLKRFGRAVAGQHQLPHMTDVEKACVLARPNMFGHDAFILDRHMIAGKLDHARALVAVPCVERQLQYFDGF